MKHYTAVLAFTQVSKAKVTVEAEDEKDAFRKAMRVNPLSIKDWRPLKGYTDVVRLRRIDGVPPAKESRRRPARRDG